ncbi:MlaD family protein [Methylomagnum ishizawai]|uniref:MlaD family protein n=1 Tax=Methylomagnum ishizawai TaxID=1760988 RepID=UPI001C3243EB|nr:MlaD family protein [Methylomagnum ishizawai]BBL76132.1 paraquat-inducible protein B [Methylomagnum ishizawai]
MNKTQLIGLFVLGAAILAIALVLIFGRGSFFSHSQKYVAYFQGSVNGLNVGAWVKLKGVPIGRVTDIRVQYDTQNHRVLTPVVAEIDLGKVSDVRGNHWPGHAPGLAELVDRGLRARLSMQSLVTAQLYVDVDFYPDRPARLLGADDQGLPEIPTIASDKDEIEDTVRGTLAQVKELPLKETFAATLAAVRRIEHLLSLPETQAGIANLNRTLVELQRTIGHLDGKIDGVAANLNGTLKDGQALARNLNQRVVPLSAATERTLEALTQTLVRAQGTLATVEDLTGRDSAAENALREVAAAARSLRVLADSLERNPELLLYGRKAGK